MSLTYAPDDLASLNKNLAMVTLRLGPIEESVEMALYQFLASSQFFLQAREIGLSCKPSEWMTSLERARMEGAQELLDYCKSQPIDSRPKHLARYLKTLEKGRTYAQVCMVMLECLFNSSVILLEDRTFQRALNKLNEAGYYMREAKRYGEGEFSEECEDYEKRIFTHLCICESIQSIHNADDIMVSVLNIGSCGSDAQLDVVFNCVDRYKEASLLAREHSLESEAIASCRLGVIFHKILKNRKKAEDYYAKCLHLANALKPRDLTRSNWYKEAFTGLEQIQQEKLSEENSTHDKLKEGFKVRYAAAIVELEKKFKEGTESLLEHIYDRHPPKLPASSETYTLPAITHENMKSLVQKAMSHYHPDKQVRHEDDWKFLCEEVMKCLTAKYDIIK